MKIYSRGYVRGVYVLPPHATLRRKVVILGSGEAPEQFVAEYMRVVLGDRFVVVCRPSWNGSYHAPEYFQNTIFVSWNSARRPFRRIRRAYEAALAAWRACQREAVLARVYPREGD
ncbi:MAG: hypothetical protein ACPLRW_05780 [Moorellales bacterium]